MIHIKRGVIAHQRHKKILKQTKGYYGARSRTYRVAVQSVIKANQYAYKDRKQKKREFRKLWIIRINAATRENGISYNYLINKLKNQSIIINRKILSDIAYFDEKTFKNLINKIKFN